MKAAIVTSDAIRNWLQGDFIVQSINSATSTNVVLLNNGTANFQLGDAQGGDVPEALGVMNNGRLVFAPALEEDARYPGYAALSYGDNNFIQLNTTITLEQIRNYQLPENMPTGTGSDGYEREFTISPTP